MELYAYVASFLYVFNSVIGIPCNAIILCIYWKKKVWNASHFFIIGHAVVDLLICTIVLPIGTVQWLVVENFRSVFLCKLLMWVNMSAPLASLHVNTLVAFDRYFAVARPYVRFVRGRYRPAIVVISVLVLAFVFNTPQLIWREIRETVREGESPCHLPDVGLLRVFVVYVMNTLVYMSHIIVTIFLYTQVYRRVKRLQKNRVAPARASSRSAYSRSAKPGNSSSKEDNSDSEKQSHRLQSDCFNNSHHSEVKADEKVYIDIPKNSSAISGSAPATPTQEDAGRSPATRVLNPADRSRTKTSSKSAHGRDKALANATFRMLFIVTVVFTSTWVLQFALRLIPKAILISMRANRPVMYAAYTLLTSLIIFNSSMNVIIYTIVNREFRAELKKLWLNMAKQKFMYACIRRNHSPPVRALT